MLKRGHAPICDTYILQGHHCIRTGTYYLLFISPPIEGISTLLSIEKGAQDCERCRRHFLSKTCDCRKAHCER